METEQPTTALANIDKLKKYIGSIEVKKRLEETLGKRAGAFANSIINVVRGSTSLQACNPATIMSAAMIAATMDLPIDPALGQAAIVPYKDAAHFQIMYRGLTQLCIRSGQYATIHCSEIYSDELMSYNPITGEVKFKDPATYKMRYDDKSKNVVGHYAYFRLLSGFEKSDFMTTDEVMAHARKFSKAYQYDLKQKKQTSCWSTEPIAMGNKTVLIRLLTKYGVMSIDMQNAIVADRETFEQTEAESDKIKKAEAGSEPIDANFESAPAETPQPVKEEQPTFLTD